MKRNTKGRFVARKWNVLGYSIIGGITLGLVAHIQMSYEPHKAQAYTHPVEPEPEIVLIEVHPSELNAVADCESGEREADGTAVRGSATHYNPDQSVKLGQFTDPAYGQDIGKYQINTLYWGTKAKELGYNLWDEDDNAAMARWIYRNHGLSPWSASQKCWERMI